MARSPKRSESPLETTAPEASVEPETSPSVAPDTRAAGPATDAKVSEPLDENRTGEDQSEGEAESTPGFDAYVTANEAILAGMADLQAEFTSFGSQRLNAQADLQNALLGCHSFEQALRLQNEFMNAATQDYMTQVNNVSRTMNAMTQNFWSLFERQARGLTAKTD